MPSRKRRNIHGQAKQAGKPDTMLEDRRRKAEEIYSEVCLLEQNFVKDTDKSVAELIKEDRSTGRISP
jgi:elongation factor Ts